ncbi:MAG: hypothetical protein QM762_12420 [Chryseolinea sp.]
MTKLNNKHAAPAVSAAADEIEKARRAEIEAYAKKFESDKRVTAMRKLTGEIEQLEKKREKLYHEVDAIVDGKGCSVEYDGRIRVQHNEWRVTDGERSKMRLTAFDIIAERSLSKAEDLISSIVAKFQQKPKVKK